jgi:predicted dehydrogenase/threonine dehydrogenase-like Zn-dependent dehydrogenase
MTTLDVRPAEGGTAPAIRQIAQNYRSGELVVLRAPQPACRAGGLLVRTHYSLISTGTELMKVQEAGLSLLGKAKARPDQVKKVVEAVSQQGLLATYEKAMDRLDSYTPLGYATCGEVIEVGAGVEGYSVGDLVACAGNEYALHADVNWVPTNLVVPVPEGVSAEHAAFATVGSIAMQGLRQAQTQIGESACVIGLGLIGQLLVRLLVANGVRVFGIDPVQSRREMALAAGAISCGDPASEEMAAFERVLRQRTDGIGVDHVFLVAGGSSNQPVETAARIARDRGRIVDIGKTRLDLPWNDYYEKELDVRFSRSYGPGRYDETYEVRGIDYPVGYVRWTQRRNLQCFLDLLAQGQVDLQPLVSGTYPVDEAEEVYQRLAEGELNGVGYLFHYEGGAPVRPAPPSSAKPILQIPRTVAVPRATSSRTVRVGFVGAGNYSSSMLLPHLESDEDVQIARVATTRSLSAVNVDRKFTVEAVSTRSDDVFEDESLDAIFIVTRHSSHADLVCRALATGKAVYVEKPLALTREQLDRVIAAVAETGNDRLMVGFNRRFSPLMEVLAAGVPTQAEASLTRYLVNAGQLPAGSWYLDQAHEGSRFVGEGGHFIDAVATLTNSTVTEVFATATPTGGDIDVHLRFEDGSLGSIAYVSNGSNRFPKETIEVSGGGRTGRLDNFHKATVWTARSKRTKRALTGQDKGQARMLAEFVESVRSAGPMPISLESLVSTTAATLAVEESLASGGPVAL